jgi:Tol biopolymer transport system component
MGRPASLLLVLCSLGCSLLATAAAAQGPDAHWQTLSTAHFRIHYPVESAAWTRHAAARLEAIWARVEEEVGYRPPEVIDVLVSDPVAQANGAALPILGWPRMVLWTSPPEPESVIGHYSDWSEILLTHEGTHLVHLLRPARNPLGQALSLFLPVGPLALKSPRWVTEGYATVVEGRLTASGRPNGDLRAAILRRRAQEGKLPSYGALNGDRSWLGTSMAYLMGSAFLEWTDARAGGGTLPKLWARMSARQGRTFDEAWKGLYGESPADLYGRFTAELTWQAVEAERRLRPAAREGALWQDLSWTTGAPALSADGQTLAIVLRRRDKPADLVVWSTAPDEKAERKWEEERKKIAERDPQDVPAARTRPLPRKALHTLPAIDGISPTMPRFLPDGKSILFVRFEPDGQGFLHPDLFRWEIASGRVERLTRKADLREPDPGPDGTWALALRNRDGLSQVVRVDLRDGAVQAVTEPTVDIVYDQPRVSPDGRRAVYARHSIQNGGDWRLALRDLTSGAESDLASPPGATVSSPAWSGDGKTVYATVGSGGFVDVWAFPLDPAGPPVPLTRTPGAALAPAPTPDGKALFYLGMQADGLDLRRLDLGTLSPPTPEIAALPALPAGELAPAVRPPAPPPPTPFALAEVPPGHPYGLGRQELFPLVSGSATAASAVAELGVRGGDVVGRLDWLVLGGTGSAGSFRGGTAAAAYRGWPVTLSFHLFDVRELPSRQEGHLRGTPAQSGVLDLEQRGGEVRAEWDRQFGPARLRLAGGGLWTAIDPRGGETANRTLGFLDAGSWTSQSRGLSYLEEGLSFHGESGSSGGASFRRYGGNLTLGLGRDDDGLRLSVRRERASGTPRAYDLVQVGGYGTSLLPDSALAGRVAVPALPAGTLLGRNYLGERAELRLGFLPAPLFYERHRMDSGNWLRLAGLEWRFALDPQPIVRIPAIDFRVGAARVFDAPLKGDTRLWLVTVLRP